MMLISACGNGGSVDDDFYKNKMIKNMNDASRWVIEDGVYTFSEKGKEGLHRKLVDTWSVQIWADPWVESERYLARFLIKGRGINYDIHNLYREKVKGHFYEFWLIKVAGREWSGEVDRSEFFLTKTDGNYGRRIILKESDQVIESYDIDGVTIRLPVDNLELLYDMQAWLFPSNYANSKLKDKKVVMDSEGKIELAN